MTHQTRQLDDAELGTVNAGAYILPSRVRNADDSAGNIGMVGAQQQDLDTAV